MSGLQGPCRGGGGLPLETTIQKDKGISSHYGRQPYWGPCFAVQQGNGHNHSNSFCSTSGAKRVPWLNKTLRAMRLTVRETLERKSRDESNQTLAMIHSRIHPVVMMVTKQSYFSFTTASTASWAAELFWGVRGLFMSCSYGEWSWTLGISLWSF